MSKIIHSEIIYNEIIYSDLNRFMINLLGLLLIASCALFGAQADFDLELPDNLSKTLEPTPLLFNSLLINGQMGTLQAIALIDNHLLLYQQQAGRMLLSKQVPLDAKNCSGLNIAERDPLKITVVCQNSILLVSEHKQLQVQKVPTQGFVVGVAAVPDQSQLLVLSSQGGNYNYGQRSGWLHQDLTAPLMRLFSLNTHTLAVNENLALPYSCYEGHLLSNATYGPLGYCVNRQIRGRGKSKKQALLYTLFSRHLTLSKKVLHRRSRSIVHQSGYLHHQRIPSLLGLSLTKNRKSLKVSSLRLTPVKPAQLVFKTSFTNFRSTPLMHLGKISFLLLDIDRNSLDEVIIFEEEGLEIFRAQHGSLMSEAFIPLKLDSTASAKASISQFLYDANQNSWHYFEASGRGNDQLRLKSHKLVTRN